MRETLDSSSPSPEEGQGQDRRRRRTRTSSFRFGKSAILVGLALLLVIAAIPAYNYYRTFVEPLQEVIVKVNDTQFTLADYIKRLRYLEQESALTGLNVDYSVDPFRLLQDFQRTELIKQASPREGITVNDEEIHQELRERLGAVPKEGEQITEEELERSFQEIYKQRLAQLKLSDAEYRDIIRELVRKDKLRDHLSDRVPTVAEHVRVLALKVEDPPAIEAVLERLEQGEEWGVICREVCIDSDLQNKRGEMGWIPRRGQDKAFDEAAFSTPVGEISETFHMATGMWVVKVLERVDARKVEGEARERLKDRALEDWIDTEKLANLVESYFDSDRYALVVNKAREYRQ